MKSFDNLKASLKKIEKAFKKSYDEGEKYLLNYLNELHQQTGETIKALQSLKKNKNKPVKEKLTKISNTTVAITENILEAMKKGLQKEYPDMVKKYPAWYKSLHSYISVMEIQERVRVEIEDILAEMGALYYKVNQYTQVHYNEVFVQDIHKDQVKDVLYEHGFINKFGQWIKGAKWIPAVVFHILYHENKIIKEHSVAYMKGFYRGFGFKTGETPGDKSDAISNASIRKYFKDKDESTVPHTRSYMELKTIFGQIR